MRSKFILLAVMSMIIATTGCTENAKHNTLTQQEIADGWQLLFDGTTLNGWRD